MRRSILTLATIFFLTCQVFARLGRGTDVGNGGNVLLCKNADNKTTLQTYDSYEAQQRHGIQLDTGSKSLDVVQKIDLVLSRLNKLDTARARQYRDWSQKILDHSEASFLSDIELIPVNDNGTGSIPKNCELKQAAQQRPPLFPNDKRYTFSKDLWDQMDNTAKAELVLHEVILRELTDVSGQVTSIRARYFNALLSGNQLQQTTLQNYFILAVSVGLPYISYAGYNFLPTGDANTEIQFYDGQHLKQALLAKDQDEVPSVDIQGHSYLLIPGTEVVLNLDTSIQKAQIFTSAPQRFNYKNDFLEIDATIFRGHQIDPQIAFFPNTKSLQYLDWYGAGPVPYTTIRGNDFFLQVTAGYLELFPDGKFKRFLVEDSVATINDYLGTISLQGKQYPVRYNLELDADGQLLDACFMSSEEAPKNIPVNGVGCMLH